MHTSSASDASSQSGGGGGYGGADLSPLQRSGSRKKVVAVEEKAMGACCSHKVRRSGFQAYGVIISLARMAAYGLAIGALWRWPAAQAGTLLGLSILYLLYLRLVVPYSRRDEMGLEYFNAVLDIVLFILVLVLAAGGASTAASSIDSLGVGLIVVQGLGFASYLINRGLIIIHAWGEVVVPGCSGAPSPKKSRSRSRSRSRRSHEERGMSRSHSESMSMSVTDGIAPLQPSYTSEGKPYYMQDGMMIMLDDKADLESPLPSPSNPANGHAPYYPPAVMPSPARSQRSAGPGMFPAITEETDSQVGSPAMRSLQHPAPPGAPGGGGNAGGAAFQMSAQDGLPRSRPVDGLDELPHAGSRAGAKGRGQNDVFDKFWKSL